ncbi:hypothetical protein, partial [Halobacillus sp. BAB-2008]|uniref:hypothetical protein n=1 Tax=Halobacillus sp. BAB-2008 TaxID=1246484 RepID=UPI000586C917
MRLNYSSEELERLLLDKGVNKSHIKKIKNEKTLDLSEFSIYYELQDETLEYIPVNCIKTTSRVEHDISWFDLALLPEGINLSADRLNRCMDHFKKSTSLATYYNFFVDDLCRQVDPIGFEYYDKDNIYSASTGNHRTIFARVTGAPYIRAKTVKFKFNQDRYNDFIKLKGTYNTF